MKRVVQFGFSVQVPDGIPLVDCREIRNPYPRYKNNPAMARETVRLDPNFMRTVQKALDLLRKHDVIGVGCGYGVHRSGTVVEELKHRVRYEHGMEFTVEKMRRAS